MNLLITVLFKQAYDITGDELAIGLIGLAQFIPAVLLVLVSGYVADRFDRRRVTALFVMGRVLCAVALIVYTRSHSGQMLPIYVISFAFGTADAMVGPSRRAIPPLISPTGMFPQVIALWTATFTASAIVGPAMGGFLYSLGVDLAYGVATTAVPRLDRAGAHDRVRPRTHADDRPPDTVEGARRAAVRPADADRARVDRARPFRSAVRRSGRAHPGHCRRSIAGR